MSEGCLENIWEVSECCKEGVCKISWRCLEALGENLYNAKFGPTIVLDPKTILTNIFSYLFNIVHVNIQRPKLNTLAEVVGHLLELYRKSYTYNLGRILSEVYWCHQM